MLKKGLCLLVAIIMLFSLSGCSDILGGAFFFSLVATMGDDSVKKSEVFEFVIENKEELLKAIGDEDFSVFENKGFIKDIDTDDDAVDFFCGGTGVGSGTSYVGFFYTPGNDATAVWCAPPYSDSLKPSGNGFEWQEQNGDNRYYTEQICENFYYYEASF